MLVAKNVLIEPKVESKSVESFNSTNYHYSHLFHLIYY
ncbi:Uncharacterised protein [Proteus vulgaris]|nr:Uncharacterised protein [Proteus vulgaris]